MAIDIDTVRHVARLANLEFSDEELRLVSRQLNSILLYIQKLNELDTTEIEPTSHVTQMSHAFREDQVVPSLPVTQALANAPASGVGHFTVPKVIG